MFACINLINQGEYMKHIRQVDSRALAARIVAKVAREQGRILCRGKATAGEKRRINKLRALAIALSK